MLFGWRRCIKLDYLKLGLFILCVFLLCGILIGSFFLVIALSVELQFKHRAQCVLIIIALITGVITSLILIEMIITNIVALS